jgi:hypothetical protein
MSSDPRIAELKRLISDGILSAKEAAPAIERLRIPEDSREPDLFRAADAYREVVNTLRQSLDQNDVTAATPLLREIVGPITAVPTEAEGERFLTAHFPGMSAEEESLLSLADGTMVAGARCQRYLALVTALKRNAASQATRTQVSATSGSSNTSSGAV